MLSARRLSNACSIGKRRDGFHHSPDGSSLNLRAPFTDDDSRRAQRQSRGRALVAAVAVAWIMGWVPVPTAVLAQEHQPAATPPVSGAVSDAPGSESNGPAAAHATQGRAEGAGHEAGTEHTESVWAIVARLFNFAILAGALIYLLRSPFLSYLEQRGITIRSDLAKAAALRDEASAQLAAIDLKLRALPGEIEALTRRGAEEIVAEEARIRAAADAERQRMLSQAKREIDSQLRVAERDLKKRAGELAVSVATERVKRTITDLDQARLVDRYMAQVRQ